MKNEIKKPKLSTNSRTLQSKKLDELLQLIGKVRLIDWKNYDNCLD